MNAATPRKNRHDSDAVRTPNTNLMPTRTKAAMAIGPNDISNPKTTIWPRDAPPAMKTSGFLPYRSRMG